MLVTIKHKAGVQELCDLINNRGVSRLVVSVVNENGTAVGILNISHYVEYKRVCERMNWVPIDQELFDKK